MELYIDKENLKSFILSRETDEYLDCLRMIMRQLHVVYNMSKDTLKDDPELLHWVLCVSEGRGDSEEKDSFLTEIFPLRPIKSNSYSEWDRKKLTSVYLIDDIDSQKLKNRGCVLLGDTGEEQSVLLRLFCGKDYAYHHLYDLQKNFNSWSQLNNDDQNLPCTDIVLNDRYIFENQFDLVKYNIDSLLSVLAENVRNRINVVFYTLHQSLDTFGVDKATRIIKSALESKTGIKPNITFVTSNDKLLIPHDRFIITNYRLIRSGDSFLYFNTKGEKCTNGGSLDIDSLANHETYVFVESLLEKLQSSYSEISRKNKDMIFGTKVSKFINFEGI